MSIIDRLRYIKQEYVTSNRMWNMHHDKEFELNRMAGDLIRYTHSIEKGLSIANPRLGFGHEKQTIMLNLIHALEKSTDEYHKEAIKMALGALNAYVKYHNAHNYHDDMIDRICNIIEKYSNTTELQEYGGVLHLSKKDMQIDVPQVEKMFLTRHSVRDFENTEVDRVLLLKAVKLAQKAPSACNRQGVRVNIINHNNAQILKTWLTGIGGFEDTIKEFILITAKHSVYWTNERYQYIVSASMYAAYLSLTLHAYGMGACVVQRDVTNNEKWNAVRRELEIPADEQAICILGVGNLKNECVVPISHRLSENIFIREI